MSNKEVLIEAQKKAGYTVCGYKSDVNEDVINYVCDMMWQRSVNLSYNITEFYGEVLDVIGQKSFAFWFEVIRAYEDAMIVAGKTYMFHGYRMCA